MGKDDQIAAGRSAAGNGPIERIGALPKTGSPSLARDSFEISQRLFDTRVVAVTPRFGYRRRAPDSASTPAAVRNGGRQKRRAHLLVVESSAEMPSYVKRFLDRCYEVVIATDGAAALDVILNDPRGLALADLRTVRRDGPVLLRAVKGNAKKDHVPVILTAPRSEEKTCSEELNAGVDDCLIKPISARQLLARVSTRLELAGVQREAAQALPESEAKYKTLLDSPDDGIFVAHDGRFVFANPALSALLGRSDAECIGLPLQSVMAPDDFESWNERFGPNASTEGLDSPWRREAVFQHREGHRICVAFSMRPVHFNRRVRDLTRRKQRWLFYASAPMRLSDRRPFLAPMAIDVTDHRGGEQALRGADRLEDEFVAMPAHELRNPLAPIRNAVQVRRQPGLSDPEPKRTRDVIGHQAARMSRLLDDLPDISRITRGAIVLKKTLIEVPAVTERAVETSLPLVKSRRHKLTVRLPQEPVQFEGDLTRLARVIAKLLNTAAKYTDAGGCVDLIVEASPDDVVVPVRDNGMSIPGELLPNIFELFTRGRRSFDRSQGGLELTLVQRLMEMHGGRVEAQSAGSGNGAEFIVHLPRVAATSAQEGSGLAGGEPASSSAGVRVLVVDDNVDSAESMALLLSLDGHEVRTAFDGPGALAVAAEFHPEAVLLDIGLPGMDGYEVAKQMRNLPGLQNALMIAVTGYGQADDRARSKAAGFDHHLVKPVDPEILSALLATLRSG